MLRLLFESVVQRCIAQSLISADGFCGRRQPDRGGRQQAAIGTKPRMEAQGDQETATRAAQEYCHS
jgi:hypothetical protein